VNTYSSKLLEKAINELSKLPGIGKKTATRLALHLIKQEKQESELLGNSIIKMRSEICFCKNCHNLSDDEICDICQNPKRDQTLVCVVEDIRDIMAIENTGQYNGIYHVLNGIISPIDGIGPDDLYIESLVEKVNKGGIKEVIMALPTTIEGDTTIYYIFKKIKGQDILVSTIARGIAIGDDLEYTDEITLGRSILNRRPFEE